MDFETSAHLAVYAVFHGVLFDLLSDENGELKEAVPEVLSEFVAYLWLLQGGEYSKHPSSFCSYSCYIHYDDISINS